MKSLKIIIAGVAIALIFAACGSGEISFRGTELAENMPTEDFTLVDQNGNPFTLSAHQGKVIVFFFGFTYCPDVCPATLSVWKRVEERLGDKGDQVKFVYITVDPERDTPEKLKQHLAIFSDTFIGLTGSLPELNKVYSAFGVYREKVKISETAAGYIVNHTSRINIVDPNGKWRLSFPHEGPVEDLLNDINLLLRETP